MSLLLPVLLRRLPSTPAPSYKQKSRWQEQHYPITYNLISGAIRVTIVVLYIWGISLLGDVRRVFQYHGAEHKVVMAYETKQPLDIEHIRPMTTLHPRLRHDVYCHCPVRQHYHFCVIGRRDQGALPRLRAISLSGAKKAS